MPQLTVIDNPPAKKLDVPFIKAKGLCNDFVMIEGDALPTAEIIALADRKSGIGCDQVVFFRMKDPHRVHVDFYNADGSLASACGNGSRALANYLFENSLAHSPLIIETRSGEITAQDCGEGEVSVAFAPAKFLDIRDLSTLTKVEGQLGEFHLVDVGNPHLIGFVDDLQAVDVTIKGPPLEKHALFPDGVNVSFAQVLSPKHIRLNVWERGAGFTGACGTAALAVAALANHMGKVREVVTVTQVGGDLAIDCRTDGLIQRGPAETVFTGVRTLSLVGV